MNSQKIGNRILLVIGILTILSGIMTVFGGMNDLLSDWNALHLIYVLAGLKLFGGLLLVFTQTRFIGSLLVISYMGGAIATHIVFSLFDFMFIVAIFTNIALWIGFWLSYRIKNK